MLCCRSPCCSVWAGADCWRNLKSHRWARKAQDPAHCDSPLSAPISHLLQLFPFFLQNSRSFIEALNHAAVADEGSYPPQSFITKHLGMKMPCPANPQCWACPQRRELSCASALLLCLWGLGVLRHSMQHTAVIPQFILFLLAVLFSFSSYIIAICCRKFFPAGSLFAAHSFVFLSCT